jgi:hypothetical protein
MSAYFFRLPKQAIALLVNSGRQAGNHCKKPHGTSPTLHADIIEERGNKVAET